MLKKSREDESNKPQDAMARVSPLLEPLLAVHGAADTRWLVDAAMTAAERGVGALYGFVFLGDEGGRLRGEEPASRDRIGPLARANQLLGFEPVRLEIDPESMPSIASALADAKAVSVASLGDALPFKDEKQASKAQRKLGASEVWLAPIVTNNETMGLLMLLMPENHSATLEAAEMLGRHIAVALSKLREGEAARKRGELDAVRWIHDERKFLEQLSIETQRAARHRRPLSVLVVRVDDYRELVRRSGRFLAERVLRRVAATMEDAMRATDFLGAYRDDSFAAILVEADEAAAANAKNRFTATLAKIDFERANLPGVELKCSCAVATLDKKGAASPQELLSRAEVKLEAGTEQQVA